MDGLTEHRPIASLPFGGKYRLIDFPLSNLANAGIRSVFGIFQNENISSVFDHIRSGREWGLSTLLSHYYLGIYNTPVESSTVDEEYYRQILTYLKRSGSDQTVALNSDVLVNIDLNQVFHLHNTTGQKITVVYKKLPKEQISDVNSVLEIDESDKVLGHELFQGGDQEVYNMSTDIFVVDTPYLIEKLEEEAAKEEPRKLRYVLRDLAVAENAFAYEYTLVTFQIFTQLKHTLMLTWICWNQKNSINFLHQTKKFIQKLKMKSQHTMQLLLMLKCLSLHQVLLYVVKWNTQ